MIDPAPAPLAEIRDRVRADYIRQQAERRANALATEIANAVREGRSMSEAVAAVEEESGFALPDPEEPDLRRIDLAQLGGNVPAPLEILFRLTEGGVRTVGDPEQRGVFIVQLVDAERGDALENPGLVQQTGESFLQALEGEMQQQFLAAVRNSVGVKRNEKAIEAARKRILDGDR